jgi:Calcineurin-like phosphoesterase
MRMKFLVLAVVLFSGAALADARQVNDYQWQGVERIVAIGDLHGDYANYLAALRAAGLTDRKDKWAGGATHLVQTGDIPDRGPDTIRIIEHMAKLARQAERKGGRVHNLMGNHEAMNAYGDLRYVHEGEYEAFVTRDSATLRDRYYELYLKALESQDPAGFAALPADHRDKWYQEHPLGWVEHRKAWDLAWNPEGEFANWVLERKVAILINDVLFVHGGISGFYCQNRLDWMTEKAVANLRNFDPQNPGILGDPFGPLWYRGLSGEEPRAAPETVDAILAQHAARHIVVGHTPTSGVIWPQYDGKVVMIDTGISKVYGGHVAYLEITPEGLFAGYPGGKLPVPSAGGDVAAYLEQVIRMAPDNRHLQARLEKLRQPAPVAAAADPTADTAADTAADPAADPAAAPPPAVSVPICGSSQ